MGRGLVNGVSARYKSLAGQRFGRLVAIEDVGRDTYNNTLWLCQCDCGAEKTTPSVSLRSGHTASCGCLASETRGKNKFVDLTGKRFGRLTVISKGAISSSKKIMWNVRCDCGKEKAIIGASMTGGRTTSCGCHNIEAAAARNKTHGMSNSPEYAAWASMISRCLYPSATGYENYGGRGIVVCERWSSSFENFYADVGERPSDSHSLDRFPDVDGNYEPGNVRWATPVEQARNKRDTFFITVGIETKSLAEWCEDLSLHYGTVNSRIRKLGWSPEEALGLKRRSA
ncbi:hypothetical protein [Rhizobium leguminosarum]|uniref:hypothetical protein n=1 Tax=Rhizobium leguminosarum TaxID=384 RepID=UPI0012BBD18A|nr:hypothetical protein [Rhizobium leguminosarum]